MFANHRRPRGPLAHQELALYDDGQAKGTLRHVLATISKVFPDIYCHDGAEYQHLWIDHLDVLDGGSDIDGEVFVAVRIGSDGLDCDIPFLLHDSVEIKGLFIAGEDDGDRSALPVLHCTHRPDGFVIYDDVTYE